jgi:hypothetical protein
MLYNNQTKEQRLTINSRLIQTVKDVEEVMRHREELLRLADEIHEEDVCAKFADEETMDFDGRLSHRETTNNPLTESHHSNYSNVSRFSMGFIRSKSPI